MRRIAILVLVVSFIQFACSWIAAIFSLQHVPVFNRGEDVASRMSSTEQSVSSNLIAEMQAVQDDIDRLNFRRNLLLALTFFCDTLLYSIAFCVFSCAVVLCHRAISSALSKLRPGPKSSAVNPKVAVVVESLEQHQERMLGLSVCSIFALLLLIVCYVIMMLGMLFLKGQRQCPGQYEAGPCSRYNLSLCTSIFSLRLTLRRSCQSSATLGMHPLTYLCTQCRVIINATIYRPCNSFFLSIVLVAMILFQSPIILPVGRIAIEPLALMFLSLGHPPPHPLTFLQ